MVYVRYSRSGAEFKGEEVLKKDLRRTDSRSVQTNYCILGLRNDQAAEEAALPPVIAGKINLRSDPVNAHGGTLL
jgi:hypothetical protein